MPPGSADAVPTDEPIALCPRRTIQRQPFCAAPPHSLVHGRQKPSQHSEGDDMTDTTTLAAGTEERRWLP